MKTLILDTISPRLYVLLMQDGQLIDQEKIVGYEHSCTLNVAIDRILNRNSLNLKDVDAFAVSVGTGSFTGIRVGIASVKGFLTVFPQKKIISINSLQTLAYIKCETVDCLMDAGRDLYYYARYSRLKEIVPPSLITKEEAEKLIADGALVYDNDKDYTAELIKLTADKIANEEYADKLSPIYLRQPQAVEDLLKK